MVPVAPSFLSPFDVAPSTTHVVPEAANSTPVIVDYWRLIVRERRHLLVPVLLAALIALVVGLRTTPVYEATSSVTFESTKGPVMWAAAWPTCRWKMARPSSWRPRMWRCASSVT